MLHKNQRLNNKSLFLFSFNNKFRVFLRKMVEMQAYSNFRIVIIMGSCIILLMDDSFSSPASNYNIKLFSLDMFFFGIFFLEICLNCIVYGFYWNGPHSYFRKNFHCLDLILTSITFVGTLDQQFNFSKSQLRITRAFRFVKICYFSEGIKVYMHVLLISIPDILRVFFLYFVNLLFFGAIAVKLFKGGFYYCSNFEDKYDKFVESKSDCFDFGGDWLNKDLNYDNILVAISSLFQFCTTEGWMWLMYY